LLLPQPQSKHTLIFKAATQKTKKHTIYFFGLWLCKRKLEQIPFCTCQNPNPSTLSSSQLLPTNKECASTPPEAELHKLRVSHSARYSARHSARPQTVVNTMGLAFFGQFSKKCKKYCFIFFVFSSLFGQYVVFTAFCGRAL